MSKMYRRKSGLIIVSGKASSVKAVPTGKEVEIIVKEYDSELRKVVEKPIIAISNSVDEEVAVGKIVVAIGYQAGMDIINASSITAGPSIRFVEDIEVISGPVSRAMFNSELDENGQPKTKRDGNPRKPHFDVTVRVPDEEGHNVSHRVRIYNYTKTLNPGDKTEIEKMETMFENWVNKEETPIFAVIATKPGTHSSFESEYNGKIYQNYMCDHMGKYSIDLNWKDESLERRFPKKNNQNNAKNNVQPQQTAQNVGVMPNTQQVAQATQPIQNQMPQTMYTGTSGGYTAAQPQQVVQPQPQPQPQVQYQQMTQPMNQPQAQQYYGNVNPTMQQNNVPQNRTYGNTVQIDESNYL